MKHTLAIALTLALTAPLGALANDCEDATDNYNSAAEDLMAALRRHASCVADSEGEDDCSSEFGRVRSVQDDFESAVSDVESYCED
jgi:hypothetical protein